MLRGGGAIRRVMSCAQFPPDNKLCFMAESSLSISSDVTSSMNRALRSSLTVIFFFFLCHVQAAVLLEVTSLEAAPHYAPDLLSVAVTAALPATSVTEAKADLQACPTAPQILGLPPRLSSFLADAAGWTDYQENFRAVCLRRCKPSSPADPLLNTFKLPEALYPGGRHIILIIFFFPF